jgi:hypothetical protein
MSFSLDGRLVCSGETLREAVLRYEDHDTNRTSEDPSRTLRLADAVIAAVGHPVRRADRPRSIELVYEVVSVFISTDAADVTVPYWTRSGSPEVIDQMLRATAALAEAGGFRFWNPQEEAEFEVGNRELLVRSLGSSMDIVRGR